MTSRIFIAGAAALGACLAALPAGANDSSAELSQGGLVLTKHTGIEMKSEDLYISAKEIRVKYRFLNTLKTDQTVLVAFPMPDITVDGEDDNLAIPTQDPVNFMDFHTVVDGRPVTTTQVEQKAIKGGVDRTALLKRLGVPLAPHLEATGKALDRLPQATKDELVRLHLADIEEYDVGQGMTKHLGPRWTLKTTYYWTQVFPAGRELAVEHRYKPSVGETSGTALESAEWRSNSRDYAEARKRWCIDDAFMDAVDRRKAEVGQDHQAFFENRIEYILKTGANWKSPIGDFRLTLDKGEPGNLLSVCETGIRKSGPTTFEVHRTNYLPDHDLKILILVGAPAGM